MKILVTGSTGLVGTALVSALTRAGHTVCRLVRPESAARGGAKDGFDVRGIRQRESWAAPPLERMPW